MSSGSWEEIEETIEENRQRGKGRLRDLATPWLMKIFLLGVGIAAIQQLTGVNTIMYYAPTMLTAAGLSNDAALFATIANGVISVVMTLAGIWLIGKVGRRPLVLIGQMGCTCCLFFIGLVCWLIAGIPQRHGQPAAGLSGAGGDADVSLLPAGRIVTRYLAAAVGNLPRPDAWHLYGVALSSHCGSPTSPSPWPSRCY
ncbi:Probable metabolite transport protein CsbC [Pantoea agglomerans]|uniref:Probable metabolite transport protein CsbC n=1 Tax=Enterobacter agglomerans TaxID=549 RepID=A0A379LR33_ENTAG|nr:Probable metabolite transport protein CsbC [Pantoea agglomerans]